MDNVSESPLQGVVKTDERNLIDTFKGESGRCLLIISSVVIQIPRRRGGS